MKHLISIYSLPAAKIFASPPVLKSLVNISHRSFMDFLLDIAKRRESEAVKESKKIDSFYIEESLSFKSSLFAASRRKKK
jgi:hypothetical protein